LQRLQVIGVASNDVVSMKDIAARTGRTYESVAIGSFDRQIAAADYLIRARRMIDDETARHELARLLAA
jgi:hypothetical protein